MVPDQRDYGRGFEPPPFEKAGKLLGGDEPQPREQGHDVNGKGAEEGVSPAPVQEISLRQVEQEESEQNGGHHEAERSSELRDGSVEAPSLDRRVEGEKRGKPIPCSAQGEALSDPEDAEKIQGPGADLRVPRQEGDRHGREAEQKERNGQLDAAAVPAVDRGEDGRADR